jgi:hypothetical protein
MTKFYVQMVKFPKHCTTSVDVMYTYASFFNNYLEATTHELLKFRVRYSQMNTYQCEHLIAHR